MGLSRTVSEINGGFSRKSQTFSHPCIVRPSWRGFPWKLELGTGAGMKKKLDGATGPNNMNDDIFSHVDTIHQRDGQMDGRTPGDSKDRAYGKNRVAR